MSTKQKLSLRELTNNIKDYYNEDTTNNLSRKAIVKAISDVLKTFDWGYYICGRYDQIKWHMRNITENTVEIDGEIWLKIVMEALTLLNYTPYDFESRTVKDYITDFIMSYAKNHEVISDYRGSIKDGSLRVNLFIDGPRGDILADSFDNDEDVTEKEEK